MAKVITRGRGRPSVFETATQKRDIFVAVRDGGELPSRPVMQKLIGLGFVSTVAEAPNGRGRPALNYVLTGKAKSLIALVNRNEAKRAAAEA